MRVIHVLSTDRFSGAENVVCQIINMYKENKDVEMFYCSPDGDIRNAVEQKAINFIGINKLTFKNLKKVVDEYKPDIIHAHDIRASVLVSLFGKKYKLISHVHTNSEKTKKLSLKSLLFLKASAKFSHIYWVSNSSLNEFYFYNNVLKNSSVLTNVIAIDEIIEKASQEECDKYDVIFVGRLTDVKDPIRLINVFKMVVEKRKNAKLAIVGDGDLKDAVKECIVSNKLEKNVDLLGFQKNPYKFMKNTKLMLMTSKFEGTPMCALEAMALGLPIISTPTDGLVELIEQDKSGFLSNDDVELKDKIVEILSDDKKYLKMSKYAENKSKMVNDIKKYKKELDKKYFK